MDDSNLYQGSRGEDFNELIRNLLIRGKLKDKYIKILTSPESIKLYGNAFTAASDAHPEDNYERFEQIGDVAASHFIVNYVYRRFKQLDCTDGVKVVARLRINYGAKKSFSKIAEDLGFWDFITGPINGVIHNRKYRSRHRKDLLEDVFEAFLGCTEYLLDNEFRYGVGYAIVYDILTSIFNEKHMSLEYEDLVDNKTQLKETFDKIEFGKELGTLVYINTGGGSVDISKHEQHVCQIYRAPPGVSTDIPKFNPQKRPPSRPWLWVPQESRYHNTDWKFLSTATAGTKNESQQKAAAIAIQELKNGIKMGTFIRDGRQYDDIRKYYKQPPPEYEFFCKK